jgi:hypothetical protein
VPACIDYDRPKFAAGARIESTKTVIVGGGNEHSAGDKWSCFKCRLALPSPARDDRHLAGVIRPGTHQMVYIPRIDLLERGKVHSTRIVPVREPIGLRENGNGKASQKIERAD